MALTTMPQPKPMNQTVTKELIRQLAGDRYFERGVNYFRQGRVTELEDFGDSVEATVEGTEEYVVKLSVKSGELEHECNCPLGEDDAFCKHCVAVALAWLDGQGKIAAANNGRPAKTSNSTKITDEDIAGALDAEDKAALVRLILDWAQENAALKEKLMGLAARRKGPETGIAFAKRALEKAIRVRRYMDYREMRGYAAAVDTAIDLVEDLFASGQAAGIIDLCETGVRWLSTAIEQVDDSDGYMTSLMERLQDLHLRACKEVMPDPVALAASLFKAEISGSFGEWSNCLESYAEVLGEHGLAAYRSLAQAAWAKVPVRTERDAGNARENYYRITSIMESMARRSGNLEELVAVLERDLSSAFNYQHIAGLYRDAGDREQALAWAERGMKAMPGHEGAGLRLFVAEEYRHIDRYADALRIVWLEFRDNPSLESYKRLEDYARADEDWDDWRGQALAYLRRRLSNGNNKPGKTAALVHNWRYRQDRSLVVEIFLYEQKPEEAWVEAQAGGCSSSLWLRMAEQREKQQPDDAKAVYLRLGEDTILRSSGNYDEGIALLERAASAARSAGKSCEFEAELDALFKKYKAKRNLQKRAAERRRFLYLQASSPGQSGSMRRGAVFPGGGANIDGHGKDGENDSNHKKRGRKVHCASSLPVEYQKQ